MTDSFARLFLGLSPAAEPSRWLLIGKYQAEEPMGFWIVLERMEERRLTGKRVLYTVTPSMCLLRWDGIITVQLLEKGVEPAIGIQSE